MKTTTLFAICATLMTTACGLQDGGDGQTTPPSCTSNCGDAGSGGNDGGSTTTPPGDGGSTTTDGGGAHIADPVIAPAACLLQFADDYISGSPCGDVVGTLPGMTWSSGPMISDPDHDGRLDYHPASIPAGSYDLSYRDRGCPGEVDRTNWALYGDPEMLRSMTADARSFIECNWYDATADKVVTVQDPGCHIRISVDASCMITGAGNMRNFH